MIPEFPQFKKVALEDNDAVEAHNRKFPYYSDYNFTSLWCWDINHKREISLLNDNLVVKFTDYETDEPFLSYLGMHDNLATTTKLLDYSESIGLPPVLKLMPEVAIYDIDSPSLEIRPDLANYDYVYLTARMAALRGNEYKSKRQGAERFVRNKSNVGFKVCDLRLPEIQQTIREIAAAWRSRRPVFDDQSIEHEAAALENLFLVSALREMIVGIVTVDEIPTAFTIEEITNKIFSIGHFWKTAENQPGEYEFMAREMASYLELREVCYWNWEQDLGVPSLRVSKISYRPSDFLKKFIVTRIAPL